MFIPPMQKAPSSSKNAQEPISTTQEQVENAMSACRILASLRLESDSVGEWDELMQAYVLAKKATGA